MNRIVQTENEIRLVYGTMVFERTIHLDKIAFPENLEKSRSGYSIGRWEDDELIVYTQDFEAGILLADARTPHSDQMRVVERFRIDPENGALYRSYVAEDPLYFSGQFRGGDTMFVSSYPWEPYECDDRSYRSDL